MDKDTDRSQVLHRILQIAEEARLTALILETIGDGAEAPDPDDYETLQRIILGPEFASVRSRVTAGMRDQARVLLHVPVAFRRSCRALRAPEGTSPHPHGARAAVARRVAAACPKARAVPTPFRR